MNVAWCMMALALAGADDGPPGEAFRATTKPPAGGIANSVESGDKIGRIDFTGNHLASPATLKTRIVTRKPNAGAQALDEVRQRLTDYYQSYGFFEVRVTPVTRRAPAPGTIDVMFVISEGTRSKVRNVVIEGNSRITTEALQNDLELHSGKPFIMAAREADKKRMLIKYAEIGCIAAEIACEPKFTGQPGVIDLLYKVTEHEPFALGELTIVVNPGTTKNKTIRRKAQKAGLSSEDVLDQTRVRVFRKRLLALGYFQPAQNINKETERKIREVTDHAEKLCESVEQATATVQTKPAADPISQAVAAFIKSDPSSRAPASTTSAASSSPDTACAAAPAPAADGEALERWPMTLAEATRIALDQDEFVRVIAFGAQGIPIGGFEPTRLDTNSAQPASPPVAPGSIECTSGGDTLGRAFSAVVSPVNADGSKWRFKSELMAKVRSVEQLYWCLEQAQVASWAAEQAVKIAEEVCRMEASKLTLCASAADAGEACQRLEQFRTDLVARSAELMKTERQLRHILGLPPADSRRIVAVTPMPIERITLGRRIEWDQCVSEMMRNQPDILQQERLVNLAQRQLLAANDHEQAESALRRSREDLDHVRKRMAHSLARMFLEIDVSHKGWKSGSRLREESAHRLEVYRAHYDAGRITPDRFLEVVSQYATAVVSESGCNAMYNTALMGLEEAKGTLLASRQITIADRPTARAEWHAASVSKDDQAKPMSFQPAISGCTEPQIDHAAEAKPATWTLSISIGKDKPVQINLHVTQDISALSSAAAP
jgi:Surface antigen variable number repeat